MASSNEEPSSGIIGRARRASLSIANANPQLGMWQATGTAIAQAPNLTELRDIDTGADNIAFNSQGHSVRLAAVEEDTGRLALTKTNTTYRSPRPAAASSRKASEPKITSTTPDPNVPDSSESAWNQEKDGRRHHHHHLHPFHRHHDEPRKKANWGPTILHGLNAFWRFFITPSGFLITIYGLNIVAWGAMLFFLLLKAAPAMNHPSANDNSSPRKKWLEIDSQILNALFCVTAFGLAPWRFRDLYWFIQAAHMHKASAMQRLAAQNKSWFRPPTWYKESTEKPEDAVKYTTFTGTEAPPTAIWKLGFTIWMMVMNTLLQAVLCFFMWHYNRIDRPSWATGAFIGLGCGVSMFAGLMSWWEGRKVKKIEGPLVEIV